MENSELYLKYDVVGMRTSGGIKIVHSTIPGVQIMFESEEELNSRILKLNPTATFIVIDRIDG